MKNIYNITGREVVLFATNELVNAGFDEAFFDASHSPNEVYLYSIKAGEFTGTKKMILKI